MPLALYYVESFFTIHLLLVEFSSGNDYLATVNLKDSVDGPRDIGISALYMVACVSILVLSRRAHILTAENSLPSFSSRCTSDLVQRSSIVDILRLNFHYQRTDLVA